MCELGEVPRHAAASSAAQPAHPPAAPAAAATLTSSPAIADPVRSPQRAYARASARSPAGLSTRPIALPASPKRSGGVRSPYGAALDSLLESQAKSGRCARRPLPLLD